MHFPNQFHYFKVIHPIDVEGILMKSGESMEALKREGWRDPGWWPGRGWHWFPSHPLHSPVIVSHCAPPRPPSGKGDLLSVAHVSLPAGHGEAAPGRGWPLGWAVTHPAPEARGRRTHSGEAGAGPQGRAIPEVKMEGTQQLPRHLLGTWQAKASKRSH